MRVITIGIPHNKNLADTTYFASTTSFLDYDLVICDLSNTLNHYRMQFGSETFMGYPCLGDDSSVKLQQDVIRRKAEMVELLKLGRMLVIITPPPILCYVATGQKQTSGTGRNARVTRMVDKFNVLNCLPIMFSTTEASGELVEFRGNEPFKSFWESNKANFAYDAYFNKSVGRSLFFIANTERAIGSYQLLEKGHLLFIPSLVATNESAYKNAGNNLVNSLIVLYKELKKQAGDYELPAWTSEYVLPREKDERENLRSLENDLSRILAMITKQKEEIAKIEQDKIALSGSGKALEVTIKRILESIGFEVNEGALNRDDLILTYKELVAVAEVKGVGKSSAESHAAQLEKWVSEYYSNHEVQPKGILIVNAFKDSPLGKRIEPAFPDQMLGYSQRREHCLITTLQLLGIYFDILQNPEKKDGLIASLFKTNGVYENYQDWNSYISYEGNTLAEEIAAKPSDPP